MDRSCDLSFRPRNWGGFKELIAKHEVEFLEARFSVFAIDFPMPRGTRNRSSLGHSAPDD